MILLLKHNNAADDWRLGADRYIHPAQPLFLCLLEIGTILRNPASWLQESCISTGRTAEFPKVILDAGGRKHIRLQQGLNSRRRGLLIQELALS